jgi:hypothetical protein
MADPTSNPPLWEVMHCAWSPHRFSGGWRFGYAMGVQLAEGRLSTNGQRLFAGDRDGDVVGQPGHCAHGSQLRPNLIQVVAMDNTA